MDNKEEMKKHDRFKDIYFDEMIVGGRSNGKAQVIAEKLVKEGRIRVFSEQELLDYKNSIINQTKRSMVSKLKNEFIDVYMGYEGKQIRYREDMNVKAYLEDICNCILEGVDYEEHN